MKTKEEKIKELEDKVRVTDLTLYEKETFKKLTRSIRSQLKRAVKLYAEYEQGSHRK